MPVAPDDDSPDRQLVEKVLNDPFLLRQVMERVYRLMSDELWSQRDRVPDRQEVDG